MISLIIFCVASVLICATNVIVFFETVEVIDMLRLCIMSILSMVAINGIVAFVCTKLLPDKWFYGNKRFFMAGKKECRFYEKLGIKKWKDKVLELGKLNSFSKSSIEDTNNVEYVKKFIIENNKGFLDHFVSIFVSFLFIFFMPKEYWLTMGLPIAITSFIINYMSVMILRYNMPRLKILLKYAERHTKYEEKEELVKE